MPILVTDADSNSQAWLDGRLTGIGASQAGAACGGYEDESGQYIPFDKGRQPLDVYLELTGSVQRGSANDWMIFGTLYEPSIVRHYEWKHGLKLDYPMGVYRHDSWPFMLASPDAQINRRTGIEIKTTGERLIDRVYKEGIASVFPSYILQVNQQCAVMQWESCWLVFLVDRELHDFEIEPSQDLIEMIAEREEELWRCVETKTPPAFESRHPKAMETLRRKYHSPRRLGVVMDQQMEQSWDRLQALDTEMVQLDRQRQELATRLSAEFGDYQYGRLPSGKTIYRKSLKTGFSLKEVSGDGVQLVATDSPEARLKKLQLYLQQKGMVCVATKNSVQEFIHLSSGLRIFLDQSIGDYTGNTENNVIRVHDPSVKAMDRVKSIFSTLK